ncbi:MAG: peptidylprolyl isomerase [Gammaproteobacteria bacterium]|nr:peptidylprolyl isomerase [Gammaproteobacteria bacterium]
MVIGKDKVVAIHYKLSEQGHEVLEDSHEDGPMVYLHGHGQLIKGLEQALEGKQAGERLSVTFSPDDAFGQRTENALQRVSINHVINPSKAKIKFKPGMIVQLNTKAGAVPATIIKVGLKTLDVDANHPYAGKTVTFDVEVINVREAEEEELAHGHVHGDGGVHH